MDPNTLGDGKGCVSELWNHSEWGSLYGYMCSVMVLWQHWIFGLWRCVINIYDMNTSKTLNRYILRRCIRYYNKDVGANEGSATSSTVPPPPTKVDVSGLSSAVIHPASQPVGPGVDPNKAGAYKVPEYFCYNNMSYFEAEIEMSKFRCPQPSAVKK